MYALGIILLFCSVFFILLILLGFKVDIQDICLVYIVRMIDGLKLNILLYDSTSTDTLCSDLINIY